METKTVAKINNISIMMVENGDTYVPIKPICEALGVAFQVQHKKLQKDEILSSVVTLRVTTGSDKKKYEMVCLPYKFIFGWLFTINPENVKAEAREKVSRYRLECYNVLFQHFADQTEFLKQKREATELRVKELERIRGDFKNTKKLLDDARHALNQVVDLTYEQWRSDNMQIKIVFPEDGINHN